MIKLIVAIFFAFGYISAWGEELLVSSVYWKADLEVGQKADFFARIVIAESENDSPNRKYRLEIYEAPGRVLQKERMGYFEDDVGEPIAMLHFGQLDSPLVVVSSKTGKVFNISGYVYKDGTIQRKLLMSSEGFPDFAMRKSGGFAIITRSKDENEKLRSEWAFYYDKTFVKPGKIPFETRFESIKSMIEK